MPANLQKCIDQIIEALQEIKTAINANESNEIVTQSNEIVEPYIEKPEQKITFDPATMPAPPINQDDFQDLVYALNSDVWPEAANQFLICDPDVEEDKILRGNGILDLMIGEEIQNLKFLDFGCGEGYSVQSAKEKNTSLAVGYDIKQFQNWEKDTSEKINFSTNWDTVKQYGPYDVILCFDVIDHAIQETPQELIQKMKSVLSPTGKIYLRAHPWTSRHANHFYHKLNKAYIHLVFSDAELKQIDDSWMSEKYYEHNNGVTKPLLTYNGWFQQAGLEVEHNRKQTEEVEDFFKTPSIAKRIQKNTQFTEFPEFQMTLQFIDYVLTHKK